MRLVQLNDIYLFILINIKIFFLIIEMVGNIYVLDKTKTYFSFSPIKKYLDLILAKFQITFLSSQNSNILFLT